MDKIIKSIKQQIKDDLVIVACSTGSDSMCLLNLCLKALNKDQIIIAHVNHNLREQSIEEEAFIKSFASEKGIKIKTKTLDKINSNIEAISREKRYEFFNEVAKTSNAKYILLAHNADDNLETIIMRILKGSSLKGYAGIEELTTINNIYLYRPLLKISKSKIFEYVNNNNIKYFNDHTNYEDSYLRNRIRNHITPLLLKENPNLYDAINYFSTSILGANGLLENEIINFTKEYVKKHHDDIYFEYEPLLLKSDYLIKEILFRIFKPFSLSRYQIEQLQSILKSKNERIITKINQELSVIKEHKKILITKKKLESKKFSLTIKEEGTYDLLNDTKIVVNKNNCYFLTGKSKLCYNILGLPLTIRNIENGDIIKRKNKDKVYHQKVNDVLTNKKISYIDRLNTLVIVNEQNEIIHILGLTIS